MVELDILGPGQPVHRVPKAVCTSKEYQGSCTNGLKGCFSVRDGTCAFNVYGHRAKDEGNTCTKACGKMGLQCVIGMEGTNNCDCNHIKTTRQQFGCNVDLTTQVKRAAALFALSWRRDRSPVCV